MKGEFDVVPGGPTTMAPKPRLQGLRGFFGRIAHEWSELGHIEVSHGKTPGVNSTVVTDTRGQQ